VAEAWVAALSVFVPAEKALPVEAHLSVGAGIAAAMARH
jgi:hypothetical protein